MISAQEALDRLREGNRRFRTGQGQRDAGTSEARRTELVEGQSPFAIILGCSDSRVPTEVVFDQGLGDLFVIRVAGNVVDSTQVGSIEFAIEQFGTGLVVVLGHSRCGAVMATIADLREPESRASSRQRVILDHVRQAVEPLMAMDRGEDADSLLEQAVRANIRASVSRLKKASELLEGQSKDHDLLIIGAEYSLETGTVEFLESARKDVEQ